MSLRRSNVDWARAKAVFGELLEAAPESRAAELDRLCGGDGELRRAVTGLLTAFEKGSEFLAESSAPKGKADPERVAAPAARVGRYRIVRELGRGGMGTVYEAIQDQPRRKVALKLLHASISSERTTERFVREAELLGRLDHPNIARVHDAGTHGAGLGGVPYFAMEFIEDASPITAYVEMASLSVRRRVELFLPVCDAVHYGHQRGIIHRDLKPGNILVGGDDLRPRVIDFGVARTTEADASMAALETGAHEIIGTLRYMSPEQCGGAANEVDVRCDVYALGIVLYEMLTGRLPYDFKSTSLLEIPRVISEAPPRRLGASYDGDLDAIIQKALEKSPDRRYQSASELAGDLRRYLDGEPIEAKHDRKWYVLRKTIWRYRAAASVAAAFFLFMTVAAVALAVLYTRAERNAENLRRLGYFQSIALAEHALDSSRTDELLRLLQECPEDLRGWEWRYLSGRTDESVATLPVAPYVALAVSPDGTVLASGGRDGIVEIWDIARRKKVAEHTIDAGFVESMSFSSDGGLLAIGTRATVDSYVLDARTGALVLRIPAAEQVKAVLFLSDGVGLVTGSADGVLALRSLETGEVLREFTGSGDWITALQVSPDGRSLAAGRNDGALETWDMETGAPGFRNDGAHESRVSGLVFSADGARLHSSGWDAAVKKWDMEGRQLDVRLAQGDIVRGLALSPDGALLAVATPTSIELRNPADGTLVRRVLGQTKGYGVAFLPGPADGARMVTWSNREAKIWNVETRRGAYVLGRHPTLADSVATAPDGRWVASAERGSTVILWDAETGEPIARRPVETLRIYRLEFSPSDRLLAGACHDGAVRVWSVPDGEMLHEFNGEQSVVHVDWRDDRVVLGAGAEGELSAWSCEDGELVWALEAGQDGLTSVACASGGDRVATGGRDGTVRIWTFEQGKLVRAFAAHEGRVSDLAWSPDGAILASGGHDSVVRLWGADDGRPRAELVGHSGLIKGVDFNADGSRLATSAWEGEIRLWETSGGTCVLRLRGHVGVVMDVEFTREGQRLLSTGNDGTVRVWEAASDS